MVIQKPKKDENTPKNVTLVTEEFQEPISDEGWQEANPKIRSGSGHTGQKSSTEDVRT